MVQVSDISILLFQATNQELAKAQKQNESAEAKAQQLEQEKLQVEQQAAELSKQKEQLQQNNSKLVITNIMLATKAKHLEDNSRALVAKQEDLQLQVSSFNSLHIDRHLPCTQKV